MQVLMLCPDPPTQQLWGGPPPSTFPPLGPSARTMAQKAIRSSEPRCHPRQTQHLWGVGCGAPCALEPRGARAQTGDWEPGCGHSPGPPPLRLGAHIRGPHSELKVYVPSSHPCFPGKPVSPSTGQLSPQSCPQGRRHSTVSRRHGSVTCTGTQGGSGSPRCDCPHGLAVSRL